MAQTMAQHVGCHHARQPSTSPAQSAFSPRSLTNGAGGYPLGGPVQVNGKETKGGSANFSSPPRKIRAELLDGAPSGIFSAKLTPVHRSTKALSRPGGNMGEGVLIRVAAIQHRPGQMIRIVPAACSPLVRTCPGARYGCAAEVLQLK